MTLTDAASRNPESGSVAVNTPGKHRKIDGLDLSTWTYRFKHEGRKYKLFKRSKTRDGSWYIDITVHGRRIPRSLETNAAAAAADRAISQYIQPAKSDDGKPSTGTRRARPDAGHVLPSPRSKEGGDFRAEGVFSNVDTWMRGLGWKTHHTLHEMRAYSLARVRDEYGIDTAQAVAGHEDAETTRTHYVGAKSVRGVRITLPLWQRNGRSLEGILLEFEKVIVELKQIPGAASPLHKLQGAIKALKKSTHGNNARQQITGGGADRVTQ